MPSYDQDDPRARNGAALLMAETDESLQAMIDAPIGEVFETTRVLAQIELDARRLSRRRSVVFVDDDGRVTPSYVQLQEVRDDAGA